MIVVLNTEHELNLKDKVFGSKKELLETLEKKIQYHCIFDDKYILYTAKRYVDEGLIEYGLI